MKRLTKLQRLTQRARNWAADHQYDINYMLFAACVVGRQAYIYFRGI